jgi:hypothetical protein
VRIKVTKYKEDYYRADPIDISGSPNSNMYTFGQKIEIIEEDESDGKMS